MEEDKLSGCDVEKNPAAIDINIELKLKNVCIFDISVFIKAGTNK